MAPLAIRDDSDDELESPSSLWAAAVSRTPRRNPTRSRLTDQVETPTRSLQPPRRTSPRFAPSVTLETTPPSIRATPARNRTSDQTRKVDSKLSDSAERRRRLADELFPPSPPPASGEDNSSTNGAPASEAGSEPETDWVADSEVEREEEERRAVRKDRAGALQSPTSSSRVVTSTASTAEKATRSLDTTSPLIEAAKLEDPLALATHCQSGTVVHDSQVGDREKGSPAPTDSGSLVHRLERLQLSLDQLQLTKGSSAAETLGVSASTSSPKTPAAVSSRKTPRSRRQRDMPATPPRAGAVDRPARTAAGAREDNVSVCCGTDDQPPSVDCDASPAVSWPDDVIENDGVLIYDPTPKKRPVKLSRAQPAAGSPAKSSTTSPRRTRPAAGDSSAGNARPDTSPIIGAKSKLRVELDLTGDSSEEDEAQRKYAHADSSDEDLPLPTNRRVALPPATLPTPVRRAAPRLPLPPAPHTSFSKSGTAGSGMGAVSSTEKRLTPTDRSTLPLALIRDLDRAVFRKRWNGLRIVSDGIGDGLPEGIEVVWNARLRNTAGRASWKTSKKTTTVDGVSSTITTHHAMVELSTKVTDTAAKLRHTLAHELCHLATWAIDGEMKPPHGAAFKLWAKRVMLVRPDIEVTTTHSYEIEYKYRWKCVSAVCGKIFGRHSASIDPATHGCPCGARIVPIGKDGIPKPGYSIVTATGTIVATPKPERKKSKWVEFLQSESPVVRKQNPTLSQPEIFKVVAERWKFAKEKAAADAEGVAADGDTGDLDGALDSLRI